METLNCCPLCGSKNIDTSFSALDYSTTKEAFSVYTCTKCSLLFTNPRPALDDLARYYDSPDYISHTNANQGLFARLYQLARNKALKQKLHWIQEFIPNKGSVLDYGSGTGEFLNFCAQNGWHTIGVEQADGPRLASINNYILNVISPADLAEIENESMDAITMWHVLEHLPDLHQTVAQILKKLKPNGILVIAVPNHESMDAKTYGKFWAAWDLPIHFYHFSVQSMRVFAAQHKLEQLSIKPMPFDAYYIALLSEQYKTGKKRWLSAIWNGWRSNAKGMPNNTSSLTYIFKKL